jgi:hypothetical protein
MMTSSLANRLAPQISKRMQYWGKNVNDFTSAHWLVIARETYSSESMHKSPIVRKRWLNLSPETNFGPWTPGA